MVEPVTREFVTVSQHVSWLLVGDMFSYNGGPTYTVASKIERSASHWVVPVKEASGPLRLDQAQYVVVYQEKKPMPSEAREQSAAELRKMFREAEAQVLKAFLYWLGDQEWDLNELPYSRAETVRIYQSQRPDLPPTKQELEERIDLPSPTNGSVMGDYDWANEQRHIEASKAAAKVQVQPRAFVDRAIFEQIAQRLGRSEGDIVWVHKLPNDNPGDFERTYLVGLTHTHLTRWVTL